MKEGREKEERVALLPSLPPSFHSTHSTYPACPNRDSLSLTCSGPSGCVCSVLGVRGGVRGERRRG